MLRGPLVAERLRGGAEDQTPVHAVPDEFGVQGHRVDHREFGGEVDAEITHGLLVRPGDDVVVGKVRGR